MSDDFQNADLDLLLCRTGLPYQNLRSGMPNRPRCPDLENDLQMKALRVLVCSAMCAKARFRNDT